MNFTKPNPIGIDYKIQQLQTALSEFTNSEWNVIYNIYGRVYCNYSKQQNSGSYVPQAYRQGKEYTNTIFFEDTVGFQMFFDIGETIKISPKTGLSTCKVFLYFFGDLTKIYPGATHRMDEECIDTIADFVNSKYGFMVHSKHRGIKKVLSDYSGTEKDNAGIRNMQPFLCFRLEMEIAAFSSCMNIPYQWIQPAYLPFVKDNPVGADLFIRKLQVPMFNYLLQVLRLKPEQYNCYPRAYRLIDKNQQRGYLPYCFNNGIDYTNPLFFQDTVALQSFFDIGEVNPVNSVDLSTLHVHLYFFADLQKIYGDNNYRNDMELLETICQFVNSKFGFVVHAKQVGIKEILKAYNGFAKMNTMNRDMQPLYCFRLDMTLKNYNTAFSICPSPDDSRQYEFAPDEFNSNQFA